MMRNQNGQTIVEYSLVLGIIVLVMLAMQPMIKRAGQGMIRVVADQIGNQQEADQREFYANSITQGHLDFARTSTQSSLDTRTIEFYGLTNYEYQDSVGTTSEQQSDLGFSEDRNP